MAPTKVLYGVDLFFLYGDLAGFFEHILDMESY